MPKEIVNFGFGYEAGFGFSQAVRAGNLVILSGQMPMTPELKVVGEGDIRAQTEQVFANMKQVLGAANLGFEDVVELVSYHTNMADLGVVADVKSKYFGQGFPAWTALGVTALAFPGQMIEIKATALAR